jgi:hypothetical protein
MLLGDFNVILSQDDKSGGRPFASSSTDLFYNFVHDNALVDLGYSGNPFTWNNKRMGQANIKERLDRSFANQAWIHFFPDTVTNHLPTTVSDHNPIILSTTWNSVKLPKSFWFESFWTRDASSYLVIAKAWSPPILGSADFIVCKKWTATKVAEKQWNLSQFGNI